MSQMPAENFSPSVPSTGPVCRAYKDRLFCHLFSIPEHALSLFNAVRGTNYTDTAALQIVTLENTLYLTMKNDLAVCFHSQLALFEQQSTDNPNMPLRGLLYFAREYEGWLARNDLDLYGKKLLKIPAPCYYVLYNGEKDLPEHSKYCLSQSFELPSDGYEWTANLLNINAGSQQKLMDACPVLKGYAELIARIRQQQREGSPLEQAAETAVKSCIADNILADYLRKHLGEVKSMILTEYNEALHNKTLHEEGHEEGQEELAALLLRLLDDGRADEIPKLAADKNYRIALLRQYNL